MAVNDIPTPVSSGATDSQGNPIPQGGVPMSAGGIQVRASNPAAAAALQAQGGKPVDPNDPSTWANAPSGSTGGVDPSKWNDLSAADASQQHAQHQANTSAIEKKSLLEQAGDYAEGVIKGVGKGALQTGTMLSPAMAKLGLVRPEDVAAVHQIATPQGTAENVGVGLETIAEFLIGDEALKGATLAEKYNAVGKILDVMKASPRLRRAVQLGMRSGALGFATDYAKNRDLTHAAEQGVEAALMMPAAEEGLALGRQALGAATDKAAAAGKRIYQAFTEMQPEKAAIAKSALRDIQPKINSMMTSALDKVAKEDGIPEWKKAKEAAEAAAKPETEATLNGEPERERSLRDKAHDLAKDYLDRATEGFKKIDKAAGGRFQRWQDQLKAINAEIGNFVPDYDWASGEQTEESTKGELDKYMRKWSIQQDMMAKLDEMAANGDVSMEDAAHYKRDFQRGMALRDLGNGVRASWLEGIKPDNTAMTEAEAALHPEQYHIDRLNTRLNRLSDQWKFGENRLRQAVGDQADNLLKQSNDLKVELANAVQKRWDEVGRRMAANKAIKIGTGIVTPAALGTLYGLGHAITHIWNPETGVTTP